ncbi:fimbrial biogenesis chaperone [Sphingobacterium sp. SYP-B4668]|uniref:fimbrial biogenesis chaperone n=1 Tax=Sphingobacterium sp. SYP-B4668 TaxID=2996035 RepID=UPI0022DDC321|nr:hypothetical protein [Sphingobacterium sp. SYP-B4668]
MKHYHILILGIICSIVTTVHAQTGLSVTPPRVYFTAGPGEAVKQQIQVTNVSKSNVLDLALSLNDWQYDRLGENEILPPDSLQTSCAGWIGLGEQTYFSLQPGEKKDIEITVQRPTNTGDIDVYTAMLFVSQINPVDDVDATGAQIKVSVRSGIKLFVRSAKPRNVQLNIEHAKFDKTNGLLELRFKNEGDVWSNGDVVSNLLNTDNGAELKLENQVFYTMPGDTRTLYIPVKKDLTAGNYIATVMLDAGDDYVEAAEISFVYE